MVMMTDVEELDDGLSEANLIEIIRSKRDQNSVLSALKQVAKVPISGRREVLASVLEDTDQSPSARLTAARQLGAAPDAENQALLVRELRVQDPSVLAVVAESLGRIGDEKALEELERTTAPSDRHAAASLDFAKTLLSYRHRVDRNLITPPADADLLEVTERVTFQVQVEEADPSAAAKAVQGVRAELPAVPLTVDGSLKITCRSTEYLLAFAEAFRTTRALRTILSRSSMPLVLLKKGLSLERFTLANYFFTQPSSTPETVVLLGTRPSGALVYAGSIQETDAGFEFTLKSVATRYAPAVDLEGVYNPRKRSFEFSRALASVQVADPGIAGRTTKKVEHKAG